MAKQTELITAQPATPHSEGYAAWKAGKRLQDNPYEWMTPHDAADAWDQGWHEARRNDAATDQGACMSDLVAQLEMWADPNRVGAKFNPLFGEAANEIRRLRRALEVIAGSGTDKLQSLQAKSALNNIGPKLEDADGNH